MENTKQNKNLPYKYFKTPFGNLFLQENKDGICHVQFVEEIGQDNCKNSLYLEKACEQLDEYLKGVRKEFNLPLFFDGTPFQKEVYQALLKIPYGKTVSYQEIAVAIHKPKAARAVGMACHKNPIQILIPCHRVIGKTKALVGYAGGIKIKQDLLELEEKACRNIQEK